MLSRRFLLATGLFSPLATPSAIHAQSEGEIQQLIRLMQNWLEENKDKGFFEPHQPTEDQKGSLILAPDHPAVRRAAMDMLRVPRNMTPLQAAKWMTENIDPNRLMEWPPDTPTRRNPANPMIVGFFAVTKLQPVHGDQTAWCAAFVNWLLHHEGLPGTGSAGSATFRRYGTEVNDPSPGDLAVFVERRDVNFGHVGFFDGWANARRTHMRLVGGNQRNRLMVSEAWPKDSPGLRFHSFRTAPGLHAQA